MLRDLSDMQAFVRVVQHGSFTAAAEAVGVPKTRISRKVQELEARLGASLLKRSTRKLGLTEAGRAYFERCAPLLDQLDEAERAIALLRCRPQGRLTVTAPAWIATSVLAPLLSEFLSFYPDIKLEVVASQDPLDLISQDIDVAFRLWVGDLPVSQLISRRAGVLPTQVFASASYIANHGAPVHPKDLVNHPALTIYLHRGVDGRHWWLQDGRVNANFPIRAVAFAADPEVLKRMMLADGGLFLATELQMRSDVEVGRAQVALPGWFGRDAELYAVLPAERPQPPKARALLDFLAPRLRLSTITRLSD